MSAKELIEKLKTENPKVIEELRNIRKSVDVDEDTLINELYEIYNDPMLSKFPEDKKAVLSLRRLRAKYANILMSKAIEYEVKVIDKTEIHTGKDRGTGEEYKYATVYGIITQKTDDIEMTAFGTINIKGSAIDTYGNIQIGKIYKVKLVGKYHAEDEAFKLATDDVTKFNEVGDFDVRESANFFIEKSGLTDIADILNESPTVFSSGRFDFRVIQGEVVNGFVSTSSNGRRYAMYVMIDDSVDYGTIQESGGLTVFVDPNQLRYATSSTIYIVGRVTKGQNGRVSMSGVVVIPDVAIEKYEVVNHDYNDTEEVKRKISSL